MEKNQKGFVKILLIILVIIFIVSLFFIVLSNIKQKKSDKSPTLAISTPINISTSLGNKFTLNKGGIAYIKDNNISLKVENFINSPCPTEFNLYHKKQNIFLKSKNYILSFFTKVSACEWSGLAVSFELNINGNIYKGSHDGQSSEGHYGFPSEETPEYYVYLKKSDYKTYAIFVIEKNNNIKIDKNICNQDVKNCPDGSMVSRTGSNCEFVCPETLDNKINLLNNICTKNEDCWSTNGGCFTKEWYEKENYSAIEIGLYNQKPISTPNIICTCDDNKCVTH